VVASHQSNRATTKNQNIEMHLHGHKKRSKREANITIFLGFTKKRLIKQLKTTQVVGNAVSKELLKRLPV
jgi:hypothetical protein